MIGSRYDRFDSYADTGLGADEPTVRRFTRESERHQAARERVCAVCGLTRLDVPLCNGLVETYWPTTTISGIGWYHPVCAATPANGNSPRPAR